MLNPASIRTITELREEPLKIFRAVKKLLGPIYIFHRSTPQVGIVDIKYFTNLIDELEDLRDARDANSRQKDKRRKLIPWKKVKRALQQV